MMADEYPHRDLADGRRLWAYPLTYGRGRLGIARNATTLAFDDEW